MEYIVFFLLFFFFFFISVQFMQFPVHVLDFGLVPCGSQPFIVFCSGSPSTLHRYSMCTIQASPPTPTTKLLKNKWNISLEWSHSSCMEDWRRASSWLRWVHSTDLCRILPIWVCGGENEASNNGIRKFLLVQWTKGFRHIKISLKCVLRCRPTRVRRIS